MSSYSFRFSGMSRLVMLQITFVVFITAQASGQHLLEGIDRHQLKISDNQKEINYGASESTIIQKFGTPAKNHAFEFEMDEVTGKEIIYDNFRFLLMDNKIKFFEFKTASVQLKLNGYSIKIGDPVSVLANFFPNYQNFHVGESGYSINLLNGSSFDEGFVLRVIYGPTTNKITKIYTHEN